MFGDDTYGITSSAARFLASYHEDVPAFPNGLHRVYIRSSPEMRNALARALDNARSWGVRSSLKAALRRFDPEAVPTPRKPETRFYVLWRKAGGRKYRVVASPTTEHGSWSTQQYIRDALDERGFVRVVRAKSADDARAKIDAFENDGTGGGMTSGVGPPGPDRRRQRVLAIGADASMLLFLGPTAYAQTV